MHTTLLNTILVLYMLPVTNTGEILESINQISKWIPSTIKKIIS
jgi:hypothetical protein